MSKTAREVIAETNDDDPVTLKEEPWRCIVMCWLNGKPWRRCMRAAHYGPYCYQHARRYETSNRLMIFRKVMRRLCMRRESETKYDKFASQILV